MTDTPNHLDELVESDRVIADLREQLARLTPTITQHVCARCGVQLWSNDTTVIDPQQFGDERKRHLVCVMIQQRERLTARLDAVRERLTAIVTEAEHCDLPHVSSSWVIRCVREALAAADGKYVQP